MTPRAILAGPGAARALRAGGQGRLELALGTGGYIRLGADGWILLAPPRAPIGPLSLLVAGLADGELQQGCPVRSEPGALVVGRRRIELGSARLTAAPTPALAAPAPAPATHAAFTAALAAAPQPPAALAAGLAALRRDDLCEAVAHLAGRGDGLTPAGDDVLAGYAGWQHAHGALPPPRPVSILAAARASPIGLAYLRCAERGELPQLAASLRAALQAGDAAVATRRARALHGGWGTSSGAALLWGMAAAASGPPAQPSLRTARIPASTSASVLTQHVPSRTKETAYGVTLAETR